MKKIIVSVLLLALCCGIFSGCVKPAEAAFDGTAQQVLDSVVTAATELGKNQEYGMHSIACTDTPVTEDTCTDILGLSTEDYLAKVESAVESKPNDSWFNHSVVVIKVKDGADTAEIADTIIKNTKPNRFGCLKPESIVGCYAGQYIIFSASSAEICENVITAVKNLSAVEPTRIDRENDWSGGMMDGGFIG